MLPVSGTVVSVLLLAAGIVALYAGAELLVAGAGRSHSESGSERRPSV